MEVSFTRQLRAMAASAANSTALRLSTGKAPGNPRQTGHTFVFDGSPKRVEQEQKILEAVSSCTWTSSPMTGSYRARISREMAGVVAIMGDYNGQVSREGDSAVDRSRANARRMKAVAPINSSKDRTAGPRPPPSMEEPASLTALSSPVRSDISPAGFRSTSVRCLLRHGRR